MRESKIIYDASFKLNGVECAEKKSRVDVAKEAVTKKTAAKGAVTKETEVREFGFIFKPGLLEAASIIYQRKEKARHLFAQKYSISLALS